MSKTPGKTTATTPDAAPASYSEDLPETPQERDRAVPEVTRKAATRQKGPDPRDAAAPYGGGSFNGTDDSSRFSTPPATKP